MIQRFFSSRKDEILPEIEKFRELQAFCSHDLRSQVGAVAGLLQLLEDQLSSLDDKTKSSYAAALTSAQDALNNLDEIVAETRPQFDSVWLIGFSAADIKVMNLDAALDSRPLARQRPVLFLSFEMATEWQPRVRKYRPLAVFFKDRSAIGDEAPLWINRLGPQLTKIYLLESGQTEIAGVRAGSVTFLNALNDLPKLSFKILDTLEALPDARK